MIIAVTDRLIIRRWLKSDLDLFSQLNQDPKVMAFFPNLLTKSQSSALMKRFILHHLDYGFSIYPIVLKETDTFIGFCGLLSVGFSAHFTPSIEIGWRLMSKYWGNGYAPEAAQAMLELGFDQFNLDEIVSFTFKDNLNSRRVMEKIGMTYNKRDDFDHPNLKLDHVLRPHVLYRIKNNKAK